MKIALYGKGGIGKSTVAANLSAALAEDGYRVLQIGCDPKHDSTRLLLNGRLVTTVLDYLRDMPPMEQRLDDLLHSGYGGVWCAEAGGPEPGVGCAGCTVAELKALGAAAANVAVHPELADELLPFLESYCGRPALMPTTGAPIGFQETARWVEAVAAFLDTDPGPALADLRKARQRAYETLSRFNSLTGLPTGATFALRADGSIALPLTQWLYHYLGMLPVAVTLDEATPAQAEGLRHFLEGIDCADAFDPDIIDYSPDLVLGSEAFISRFRARGVPVVGIDIALPAGGFMEIIPRCHLGATGALWLLEEILNGMLSDR